jgi:hypothetical protein
MAVPLCRGSDESDTSASMLLHIHKGHAFFYQDDLLDEQVIR